MSVDSKRNEIGMVSTFLMRVQCKRAAVGDRLVQMLIIVPAVIRTSSINYKQTNIRHSKESVLFTLSELVCQMLVLC